MQALIIAASQGAWLGGSALAAPEGFAFVTQDGDYVVDGDGNYIVAPV